jgi:hypothetical protein
VKNLLAQHLVSERGKLWCNSLHDTGREEEGKGALQSDVVIQLVEDLGRALEEASCGTRGLNEEVGSL